VSNRPLGAGVERRITFFKEKAIRKTIPNNEWWFFIADVLAV
jgi:hypothetical protein